MCKFVFLYLFMFFGNVLFASPNLSIQGTNTAQMGLMVGVIGKNNSKLKKVAQTVKSDIAFSGQFKTAVQIFDKKIKHKKEIMQFFKKGYQFALTLNYTDSKKAIEYRLFDTTSGNMIIKASGKYRKQGKKTEQWGHHIAQKVWPVITGQEGAFTSKIAYCKQVIYKNGLPIKQICVADYDGGQEHILVDAPTVNISPRWNVDVRNPSLSYSEFTDKNVRLVFVDVHTKKSKTVSDFEGVNMQLAYSLDGKNAVYAASRGKGSCQIYLLKNGELKNLTNNQGNNVSPCMSEDGNIIYYCSDFRTGLPQIYAYHINTGQLRRITNGGFCASPAYCAKGKQLVYGKKVKGIMQLFVYDEITKEHTQVTTSVTSKEECSWSPCGNYIAYACEKGLSSRIAVLNLITGKEHYITQENDRCSYPSWSPCYNLFPEMA